MRACSGENEGNRYIAKEFDSESGIRLRAKGKQGEVEFYNEYDGNRMSRIGESEWLLSIHLLVKGWAIHISLISRIGYEVRELGL